jgi:hypothetical protein
MTIANPVRQFHHFGGNSFSMTDFTNVSFKTGMVQLSTLAREVDEFLEHEDGEGEVVKAGAAVERDSSV